MFTAWCRHFFLVIFWKCILMAFWIHLCFLSTFLIKSICLFVVWFILVSYSYNRVTMISRDIYHRKNWHFPNNFDLQMHELSFLLLLHCMMPKHCLFFKFLFIKLLGCIIQVIELRFETIFDQIIRILFVYSWTHPRAN